MATVSAREFNQLQGPNGHRGIPGTLPQHRPGADRWDSRSRQEDTRRGSGGDGDRSGRCGRPDEHETKADGQ